MDGRAVFVAASFAAFAGVHGGLLGRMATRAPLRAAAGLVIPPLVPYWGFRLGMRRLAVGWGLAVAVYVIAIVIARL